MPTDRDLILLAETRTARLLLGTKWRSIETSSGQLKHELRRFPGAWSAPSLLIHTDREENVLIYAEVYECQGQEKFGLRFVDAADGWARQHIKTARPPFAPILTWPANLELPAELVDTGPSSGKLGLGTPVKQVKSGMNGKTNPLCWVHFHVEDRAFLIFIDDEIPMNVGIAGGTACEALLSSIQISTVAML